MAKSRFLTADWRYLVMLNYGVHPDLLLPYLPRGTELDVWNGRFYVSIVGFMMEKTRLLGVPVPGHVTFEEVNLRFYVRRKGPEGWRRGVVFIKELVPKPAIAMTARAVYNEAYVALPMRHALSITPEGGYAHYEWQFRGRWHRCGVRVSGEPRPLAPGSEAEFITEHYWGYAAQKDGGTVEYQVEHPPWRVWQADSHDFWCNVAALYGPQFAAPLAGAPLSAFMAEGSAVVVRQGTRL